jgi:4-aminobutyrate aminotransferase
MSSIVERGKQVLTTALGWDTEIVAVKASGAVVTDEKGREYLDFACGTAVTNIGHNHPAVMQAAREQMDRLIHTGGVFYYESVVKLGEELGKVCPGGIDTFFFSNAGAEAVEGAVKLARYVTERPGIVCFTGAFHGRTLGCVSLTTSTAKYRTHYRPLLPEIYRIPFPNPYRNPWQRSSETVVQDAIAHVEKMFREEIHPSEIAAFLIEPVQGEGGYIPAPREFLLYLRETCTRHGIQLIFDEVQSGFGRTANWFAAQAFGVDPDIMAMAKGIAGGFPLSAVAARRETMRKWSPGAHGTTFGGNPVSCAAAVATIEAIRRERLLEHAREMAALAFSELKKMAREHARIGDVRGVGLMIGIELVKDPMTKEPDTDAVDQVRRICQEQGLVLINCGTYGNVIRFIPPMVVTESQLRQGLKTLEGAFAQVLGGVRA